MALKILFSPSESKISLNTNDKFDGKNLIFSELFNKRAEILKRYDEFLKSANLDEIKKLFGLKELEDSGCLPITDGQLKAMAQRISETVYAILDQKYGSTSNLKLVRTKNSHRSMEDIIFDPNPPKNIKIKLDDDSSFSIFILKYTCPCFC